MNMNSYYTNKAKEHQETAKEMFINSYIWELDNSDYGKKTYEHYKQLAKQNMEQQTYYLNQIK